MPLFGNQQNQNAAAWEPPVAMTAAHTAGANPAGCSPPICRYRSTCSWAKAGFEPLGFVVGSSIYQ